MPTNFYLYFVAALIPMLVGAVYYHPAVVGKFWMRENGFTTESLAGGSMAKIFGFAYLFSLILAFTLSNAVIHQTALFGLFMPDILEPSSEGYQTAREIMMQYGDRHRTFSHGLLHGVMTAIMFALPIFAINSLFERKSWRYNFIHTGYWVITLGLMGGLLCATLKWAPLT